MTDYFALLDEPRRPWIDPEPLKEKFLRLASDVHPDRVHEASAADKAEANRRYAEFNAAYQCLRDPKERLGHLLTLELGAKPQGLERVTPELMDTFVEINQLGREVDRFLAERANVQSPMLKVRFFERGMEWSDRLSAALRRLNEDFASLATELKQMNAVWQSAPPDGSPERASSLPLNRAEEIYRALSYNRRWAAQLLERVGQLVF